MYPYKGGRAGREGRRKRERERLREREGGGIGGGDDDMKAEADRLMWPQAGEC